MRIESNGCIEVSEKDDQNEIDDAMEPWIQEKTGQNTRIASNKRMTNQFGQSREYDLRDE